MLSIGLIHGDLSEFNVLIGPEGPVIIDLPQVVNAAGNEEKGKIKDLMLSGDGRVEYAAVSFGGFLGMGNKLFAVPLDAIHIEWKDNKVNYATVDVSEDSIKQRQGFDEKNWPEHADRGFLTNGGANNGTHARKTTSTSTPTTTTTSNNQ